MTTTNPLQQAIDSAIHANDEIGRSFARLGSAAHPRGFVMSAYRNSFRAMKQALKETDPLTATNEVMNGLKITMRAQVKSELTDMVAFGVDEGQRQLSYYEDKPTEIGPRFMQDKIDAALAAILATIDAQSAAVRAMILTGASEEQIIGSEERRGVLRPGIVLAAGTYWTASLVWEAFSQTVNRSNRGFMKQAIAALDARTTDCCLRAHGQIKPLNGRFHLVGTPRYADDLDWSPFHDRCRTSVALYLPEYDNGITMRLRDSADQILREREQGGSGGRHPASAYE